MLGRSKQRCTSDAGTTLLLSLNVSLLCVTVRRSVTVGLFWFCSSRPRPHSSAAQAHDGISRTAHAVLSRAQSKLAVPLNRAVARLTVVCTRANDAMVALSLSGSGHACVRVWKCHCLGAHPTDDDAAVRVVELELHPRHAHLVPALIDAVLQARLFPVGEADEPLICCIHACTLQCMQGRSFAACVLMASMSAESWVLQVRGSNRRRQQWCGRRTWMRAQRSRFLWSCTSLLLGWLLSSPRSLCGSMTKRMAARHAVRLCYQSLPPDEAHRCTQQHSLRSVAGAAAALTSKVT